MATSSFNKDLTFGMVKYSYRQCHPFMLYLSNLNMNCGRFLRSLLEKLLSCGFLLFLKSVMRVKKPKWL